MTPQCAHGTLGVVGFIYKMKELMFFSSNFGSFKACSIPARQVEILISVLQEQKEAAIELLDDRV